MCKRRKEKHIDMLRRGCGGGQGSGREGGRGGGSRADGRE